MLKTFRFRAKRKFYVLFPKRFSPYTIQAKILGEEFPFFIGTFEGSHWYGKHKDHLTGDMAEELRHFRPYVGEGDILADIGAHHGYFALLFSKWVGNSGKVYAFECLPTNSKVLKKNIALNPWAHIEPIDCAVGEKQGQLSIANDSSGALLSPKEKCTLSVPMMTLDDFFKEHERIPNLLKIDVEGYEWEVLQGAKTLLHRKPKVLLEIHNFAHQNPAPRLKKIFALFQEYATVLWQAHPKASVEPFSLSDESMRLALQQPNPRLYLIP